MACEICATPAHAFHFLSVMSGPSSVKRGFQDARPSAAAFELHLLSALRDAPATRFSVRQPWDVGICSDASARKRFLPGLPAPHRLPPAFAPSLEPSHPEVARMQGRLDAAGDKFAKRAKHATWDAKETEEKNFALFKWLRIIERGPWDFAVSRDFLRARLLGLGAGELFDSISDALAAKSTSTLHTRAGPILRYVAFCESEGLEPFPVREEVVYRFFYDMQAQVAATFFKSVLSSFAFRRFVLGLDSAVLALDSLRVKGLARKLYLGIRRLQQRPPPLRVKDVIRLESICTGDIPRSSVDIVMAGFVLFMLYARARHSAAQHVCTLIFDPDSRGNLPAGFIDTTVRLRKLRPVTLWSGKPSFCRCWPRREASVESVGRQVGRPLLRRRAYVLGWSPLWLHLGAGVDGMRFLSRLRLLVCGREPC